PREAPKPHRAAAPESASHRSPGPLEYRTDAHTPPAPAAHAPCPPPPHSSETSWPPKYCHTTHIPEAKNSAACRAARDAPSTAYEIPARASTPHSKWKPRPACCRSSHGNTQCPEFA